MINKQIVALITFILILVSPLFSSEIHDAVQEGNLTLVQELIEADNTNLDLKDERQFTPLNWAVTSGHLEIFMYLLNLGADINTVDIDGSNLLINAAGSGKLDIVRYLVEDKGFDVNFKDNNEYTPFSAAAGSGSVELLKYMIEKGANIHTATSIGTVPIVNAIYSDSLAAVEYLFELGCEYDVPNQWNVYPVHYAAYRGNIDVIKLFLDRGVDIHKVTMNRETPFFWAVVGRRFEMADFLLENGVEINTKVLGGVTALHSAHKLRMESLDYLLGKGADITAVDSTGNTVLHAAAWSQRDEIILKLIESGVDINAVNNNGATALVNACNRDSLDVIQVLLDNGATLEVGECTNENGCTTNPRSPLNTCVNLCKVDFVELLLKYNADVNHKDHNFERTPLHLAAIRGNIDILNILIDKGAEINAKDCFNKTPLYYANIYNNGNVAEILAANNGKCGKIAKKYKQDLLQKKVKGSEANIWFANHAGWVFQTANNLLIIDYWERGNKPEKPCLANGWIDPEEIKDFNVTVLVSHEHADHYDPVIWEWRETIPNIRYILGMEVPGQEGYEVIQPRTTIEFDDLNITAFESNDSGVGFVIEVDGVTIFHPGDHANEIRDFSGTYWPEIEYVKENFSNIDIAMMPIRGCGLPDVESVRLGVIRTLKELKPKVFLPMHSVDDGFQYRNFNENLKEEGIKNTKLYYPLDKGDRFLYKRGRLK